MTTRHVRSIFQISKAGLYRSWRDGRNDFLFGVDLVAKNRDRAERKTEIAPKIWFGNLAAFPLRFNSPFQQESMNRLLVNAVFWTTQRDPEKMKK